MWNFLGLFYEYIAFRMLGKNRNMYEKLEIRKALSICFHMSH